MKLLLTAVCMLFTSVSTPLMILDKNLKKPVRAATEFSVQDYQQHTFPIYTADKEAIIAAADEAARWIEQVNACYTLDSIETPHTRFIVSTDCKNGLSVSVTLMTEVAETRTAYSFALVKFEGDKRKAQQRLMDFATYINQ